MLSRLLEWCDKENPQNENENMVIRYGAELLVDNGLKILLLITLGFLIGKGAESVVFFTCVLQSSFSGRWISCQDKLGLRFMYANGMGNRNSSC